MHSSRMRTGCSLTVCRSLLLGGGELDLISLNFPLGCRPGSDPPQFPPWVWAWKRGASFLGGGVPWQGGLPGGGWCLLWGVVSQYALRQTTPVIRMTNSSKNITLATTSLRPVMIKSSKNPVS